MMAKDNGKGKETASPQPEDYTVGWICAIPKELTAARAMLDSTHGPLEAQPKHDENNYVLGMIGKHNVAIACLPEYGVVSAAVAAKSMQNTFPRLRFGLMVGIGGGMPSDENDIRLGDIVVSLPEGQHGGVIQYDLGRAEADGFHRLGTLNKPPQLLRTAVATLRSARGLGKQISRVVNETFGDDKDDDEDTDEWTYPAKAKDVLFKLTFNHVQGSPTCDPCLTKSSETIKRQTRKSTNPRIFYGNIASGNSVMKNALKRDALAKRDSVICIEMEAAGLMDSFPCLVIRGICDYADSHKNKKWQPYAAAAAAAYAKELLSSISSEAVAALNSIRSKYFSRLFTVLVKLKMPNCKLESEIFRLPNVLEEDLVS
jgi:nucleoside phosphorylase